MGIPFEVALVLLAAFLILCTFASKASSKLGIPSLILFILIGMLAGSDGPGGIAFTNVEITKDIGLLALAFILFSGGLDTNWAQLRPVIWRGLSLATIGVVVTAGLVGSIAHYVLGLPLLPCLLLGAIVSPTDAAAVFGVVRGSGLRIKHRLVPTLELESGTNDPLAVFLTTTLVSFLAKPETSISSAVAHLFIEMPLGFGIGLVVGYGSVLMINRLRLEYDGLYSIITIAAVCLSFGGSTLIGGNPFLAVYVAGVYMGSRNFLHKIALLQFHEGIAWLMQIAMFVLLGLLCFPHQLWSVAWPGSLIAVFLILVARPVAVYISLAFAHVSRRSRLFIGWAGLRGAVPIILATFPLMAKLPNAQVIFNLVFFIVLASVLIQGTSLKWVARRLGVAVSHEPNALPLTTPDNILKVTVAPGSRATGKQVVNLDLPPTALLVLLERKGEQFIPRGATEIAVGDTITIATRRGDHDELRQRFESGS